MPLKYKFYYLIIMELTSTPLLQMFTVLWCLVTFVLFIVFCFKIQDAKDEEIKAKKFWIDQQPSIISTLGVLGTFAGITIGLINFDTSNLDHSIPLMLEGLKTAFFTSLTGMFCSMILNRITSAAFDRINKKEVDTANKIENLTMILEEFKSDYNKTMLEMQNALSSGNESDGEMLECINNNLDTISHSICQLSEIKASIDRFEQYLTEISERLESINERESDSAAAEVEKLGAIMLTATESISSLDNIVDDINKKMDEIKKLV